VQRDEGPDAATAKEALEQLLDTDQVDAIIGPASSNVALALVDRIVEARVVACSPTNTAIALGKVDDGGLYVRTMPSDSLQSAALARAIAETGRRSAAVLYPDDDYGRDFVDALRLNLRAEDVNVATAVPYDRAATSFRSVVTEALAADPQAVAIIGQAVPGGGILAELQRQKAGPEARPTFVTDGLRRASLFEAVDAGRPASVAGIQGTSPAPVWANAGWFEEAFATFSPGAAVAYAPYAYDCTNLIALAAQSTGSDDAVAFAAELGPSSRGGTVCRNFPQCAVLVAEGRNIDLDGASGLLELQSNGDPGNGIYEVFQFDDSGADVVQRQIPVNEVNQGTAPRPG
jgi:branched-chain amino acid transport system substrate-binding protein